MPPRVRNESKSGSAANRSTANASSSSPASVKICDNSDVVVVHGGGIGASLAAGNVRRVQAINEAIAKVCYGLEVETGGKRNFIAGGMDETTVNGLAHDVAKRLVDLTGWNHAKVQAEMNRLAGVTRVATATTDQLERRLRYAESWLRRLRAP